MDTIWFIITIFIIVIFLIKLKSPTWKGRSGERFISNRLHELNPAYYKILDDIMLPSNGKSRTTQIDHIVVSNYGIFCIETKAFQGWVFGNANQKYWRQVIYKHKQRFYNPLWQNFAHIKAIESLIGSRLKKPIVSLIIFSDADKLNISGTDSVGYRRKIIKKIINYDEVIYSDIERDEIYDLLLNSNITDDKLRDLHKLEVKNLKKY